MATNHLGHFAFVTTVLDTIQSTATTNGEARIVVVSSEAVKFAASGIDYKALTTRIPGDGKSLFDLKAAMLRYANSKLANIYFAEELDRRLRAESVENVYVDSCHPGAAGATGIGDDVVHGMLLVLLKNAIKGLLKAVANTNVDSARTQVFLAASKKVRDEDIHGQFWYDLRHAARNGCPALMFLTGGLNGIGRTVGSVARRIAGSCPPWRKIEPRWRSYGPRVKKR